jgi:Zn-dependent protease
VVGRAAGAPVVVSPGWFLAAVVLTFLFEPTVRAFAPGIGAGSYAVAAGGTLVLFVSVFLHELAHALVARRCGVIVQEIAVTLLGGHTRMGAAARTPGRSALIGAAGPAANLLLAALAWAASLAVPAGGVPSLLLTAAALTNGFVGIFNLLPGLPLDGGRVLEAAIWRATGRRSRGMLAAGWVGRLVAVAVVVWAGLPALSDVAAGRSPDVIGLVWPLMIALFLWTGAAQAIRAAKGLQAVEHVSVESLMSPAAPVPADGTVAGLGSLRDGRTIVLIDPSGVPVGYVDAQACAAVPDDRRASTPLVAVAVQIPPGAVVERSLTGGGAVEAIGAAARHGAVLAVTDLGRVVGLLRTSDVISALRTGT